MKVLPNTGTISIHAPAKGATGNSEKQVFDEEISIHAPAKGATVICFVVVFKSIFQSTLPQRERLLISVMRVRI